MKYLSFPLSELIQIYNSHFYWHDLLTLLIRPAASAQLLLNPDSPTRGKSHLAANQEMRV
jgi:hypothetical protein